MRKKVFLTCILWSGSLLWAQQSTTQESKAEGIEILSARQAEYIQIKNSTRKGVFILKGGLLLKLGSMRMRANTVKVYPDTGEIFSQGSIILEDKERTIEGRSFYFDNNTGIGVMLDAEGHFNQIYLKSKRLTRIDKEKYKAREAFFTSCEESNPHYHFRASRIWLKPTNELIALNVFYYAGNAPVFYWPILFQTDIGTGILTRIGFNDTRGGFIQNTWRFHIQDAGSWFPQSGSLMLDYYQRVGGMFGMNFARESRNLTYNLQIAVADHKQREVVTDPLTGQTKWTDKVITDNGTAREVHEFWYKLDTDIRSVFHSSYEKDAQSSLYIKMEAQNQRDFDIEFLERPLPENTLDAIVPNAVFSSAEQKNSLLWEIRYAEDWRDNHLMMTMKRQLIWYEPANADSGYVPSLDLSPEVEFTKRFFWYKPASPSMFAGVWNDLKLKSGIHKFYDEKGDELKTIYKAEGQNKIQSAFTFFPWLTVLPGGGYGLFHEFAQGSDPLLTNETGRSTYQYVFTDSETRLGPAEAMFIAGYQYYYAFEQRIADPTFGAERIHRLNLSFLSDFQPYYFASLRTSRDMRAYPYTIPEHFRYTPLVAEAKWEYDFIHGYLNRFGIPFKNRHFFLIGLNNEYRYFIRYQKSGDNATELYTSTGGFTLPGFYRFTEVKTGINLYHDFTEVRHSSLLWFFRLDTLPHKLWRVVMEVNSKAEEFERYLPGNPDYVPFTEDLGNSLNPDTQKRNSGLFSLQKFSILVEHDLHRWLLRLSYSVNRRNVPSGPGNRYRAEYYEQTAWLSLTLKDIPGFGLPRTEVFRRRPSQDEI